MQGHFLSLELVLELSLELMQSQAVGDGGRLAERFALCIAMTDLTLTLTLTYTPWMLELEVLPSDIDMRH